jgi:hypothetical protein
MTGAKIVIRPLLIVCFVIVLGCVLTSCDRLGCMLTSCNKPESTKKGSQENYTENLNNRFTKPNQEAIALLAVKYDVQPDLVEKFLDIYLSDTNLTYRLMKELRKPSGGEPPKSDTMQLLVLGKEGYSEALAKASHEVGIAAKTAALLLLDYRTYTHEGNNRE